MGTSGEDGFKTTFFRLTCGSRKAHAAERKSLREPESKGRRTSEIIPGRSGGVQRFGGIPVRVLRGGRGAAGPRGGSRHGGKLRHRLEAR